MTAMIVATVICTVGWFIWARLMHLEDQRLPDSPGLRNDRRRLREGL